MHKALDLTGQRIGTCVVLEFAFRRNGARHWKVRCDCGHERAVSVCNLRTRGSSCPECAKVRIAKLRRTHGESGRSPEHRSWASMITRCQNPSNKSFKSYGGRGIRVCERWRKFENFLADMGRRPSARHSLDRKNVDGHYEPENCRWATAPEQGRNKRKNHLVTIGDETKCVADWAEIAGVRYGTMLFRVKKGWTGQKLLRPAMQSSVICHTRI